MLATKLNMSSDDAEKWIVNLIRNAKLDAKIDAKEVSVYYSCRRVSSNDFVGIGSRDHEHSAAVCVPESDRQDKSTGLPESIHRSER